MGRPALLLSLVWLAAGNPLLQTQRPPQQTTVQSAAQAKLVADAHTKSQAARDWVLQYLSSEVRDALQGTSLQSLSGEDLLARLDWEFKRLPLIHNGPLDAADKAQISDDTNLEITLSNGYLQNVCQRWTLGAPDESENNLLGEHYIMTKYMGLPEFQTASNNPTLREANSCVMYLATNLRKTHCGNFIYGSVTYAVNPMYRDKFALTPFDTGNFVKDHESQLGFGTLDDYYHLFQNHVQVLGYNFAEMFKRWYIDGTPPPSLGDFPYFEVEWLGNAWLPESLLYVLVKFSGGAGVGVWGTDLGRTLQQFMLERGRPLLWADGDDSGILIDATVNNIEGRRVTQDDAHYFDSNWNTGMSFQDFYNGAPSYLKMVLPNYDRRQICEQAENSGHMVLGTDQAGNCVYWVWNMNPTRWECMNDGTCVKSDSNRGSFFSEQACLESCGQGMWACASNLPDARPGAHFCEPQPNFGRCASVDACEKTCGAPPPPPPPKPHMGLDCTCLSPGSPLPKEQYQLPCSECDCGNDCCDQCYAKKPFPHSQCRCIPPPLPVNVPMTPCIYCDCVDCPCSSELCLFVRDEPTFL